MRTMAFSSLGGPESVMIRTGKAEAEAAVMEKVSAESLFLCLSYLPSARAAPKLTFILVTLIDSSVLACKIDQWTMWSLTKQACQAGGEKGCGSGACGRRGGSQRRVAKRQTRAHGVVEDVAPGAPLQPNTFRSPDSQPTGAELNSPASHLDQQTHLVDRLEAPCRSCWRPP